MSAALRARIAAFRDAAAQLHAEVKVHVVSGMHAATEQEAIRLNTAQPYVWLNQAEMQMSQGLMALERAVDQPTHF